MMHRSSWKRALLGYGLAMSVAMVPLTATAATTPQRPITQMIVKFKPLTGTFPASAKGNAYAMTTERITALSTAAGMVLGYQRPMSGNAHVVRLPRPMSESEASALATQLAGQADVAYAEPDAWMSPAAIPNDPAYSLQWHYKDPVADGVAGAANLPGAWDITTGSRNVVVAVVDTGVLNHSELTGNLIGGASTASGYDMISYVSAANSGNAVSNDGDGRDADPTDPGDWVAATDPICGTGVTQTSSWHGTHVAGTIGAVGNDGTGVTGVNWQTSLLTVRALGSCGGLLSDIADGIAWAAGEAITGVPANSNPAKVINLSLGGFGACGTTYSTAINAAVARGATVVVAAGNNSANVVDYRPANCANVVTVAAVGPSGGMAYYSNYDTAVDNIIALAAPGGEMAYSGDPNGVYSTLDGGSTVAQNDNTHAYYQGTSMATPHVSGIVALMLAANSNLTDGTIPPANVPALIKAKLKASARTFPTGTAAGGGDCTTTSCGAGIVDAAAAIQSVSTPPTVNAGIPQNVNPAQTVTLSGSATDDGSVTGYTWTQTAGLGVTLSGATTATASFSAPANARVMTFQLTATDDVGLNGSSTVDVTVTPPAPSALTAAASSASSINLSWADNSENEAGFKLERRVAGTASYTAVTTLPANSTSYSDSSLVADTTYEYRLYAYYDLVSSAYSATATATTLAVTTTSSGGGGGGGLGWLGLTLLGLPLLRRIKR